MREILLRTSGSDSAVTVGVQRCSEGEGGDYRIRFGDECVDVDVIESCDGRALLRIHGRIVPVYVHRNGNMLDVWLGGRTYHLELMDRVARRTSGAATVSAVQATLTAPMPGTIMKIHVASGDAFAAHQPLIVMESMKMEMTLSAPHDGQIKEVLCRPGQLVEMGALLAKFEDTVRDDASR